MAARRVGTSPVNDAASLRELQRRGLHALAEPLLRQLLRKAHGREREDLLYLLALSLDALGRPHEAAACYAQAMDSALAPLLQAQQAAPGHQVPQKVL